MGILFSTKGAFCCERDFTKKKGDAHPVFANMLQWGQLANQNQDSAAFHRNSSYCHPPGYSLTAVSVVIACKKVWFIIHLILVVLHASELYVSFVNHFICMHQLPMAKHNVFPNESPAQITHFESPSSLCPVSIILRHLRNRRWLP